MLRRAVTVLLAPLALAGLLSACDGEKADFSGERYDILWTWAGGNSELNVPGVYGVQATADAANKPGAREGALHWTDSAGNLWLFGGRGFDGTTGLGLLHDLWKFDGSRWTWVAGRTDIAGTITHSGSGIYGVAPGTDWPGARRDAVTWTDSSGDLWLFGGYGYDELSATQARLNDLWRYNIASGHWTWVGGSKANSEAGVYGTQGVAAATNWPGARYLATGWTDSRGAFWLFGGDGYDGSAVPPALSACCMLNDLWKYSAGQWTWMAGSDLKNPLATYGAAGTAAAANTPSGRSEAVSWYDSDGNAWLYGGTGSLASSTFVSSELWKYTSSGWAWISGTQGATENASYGPRGAASVSAQPGSRLRAAAWYGNGFLWLFGGEVMVSGVASHPNDLWRYNGATWTWVGGSDEDNLAGAYRDTGVGRPGGRDPAAAWTGSDGRFWLFGGEAGGNLRNDLWYYQP